MVKTKSGNEEIFPQSIGVFAFNPRLLKIELTISVGPTKAEVPVSTIPLRSPTLKLFPLRVTSSTEMIQ